MIKIISVLFVSTDLTTLVFGELMLTSVVELDNNTAMTVMEKVINIQFFQYNSVSNIEKPQLLSFIQCMEINYH